MDDATSWPTNAMLAKIRSKVDLKLRMNSLRVLLLSDESEPATHFFDGSAVFPADAVQLQAVVIHKGKRGFVY